MLFTSPNQLFSFLVIEGGGNLLCFLNLKNNTRCETVDGALSDSSDIICHTESKSF